MSSKNHLSIFGYALSRPYPYKWFTWVVIVGGICATTFFSILNLAANGYILDVRYCVHYNKTVNSKQWSERFPFSIVDKAVPSCQPQNIPVNSQFFTNNSALPYTLTGVLQQQGNANSTLPSLKYANNIFENCTVAFIEIDLESTQRTAAQQGWVIWGPKALAQVSCSISNDRFPTYFNLTVGYEFITPTIETGTAYSFLQRPDPLNQTSLWWGESLLSWYWLNLATAIGKRQYDAANQIITKGSISFRPSKITDMISLDFFEYPSYHFLTENLDPNSGRTVGCCINPAFHDFPNSIENLAQYNVTPNIWIEADSFAKSFYASILADLGQNASNNMLANGATLEYFTSNLTSVISGQDGSVEEAWLATNPATQSYDAVKRITGNLTITPSVISAQYLCQIPKLKPAGSLFVAIFLGDLVFLQALWVILNWTTTAWLERSDPHANFCEGCRNPSGHAIELAPVGSATATQFSPMPVRRRQSLNGNASHDSLESEQRLLSTT